MERFISSEGDREMAARFVAQHTIPFTLNLTKGDQRTLAQNRLQHLWIREIADALEQEPDEVRAWCKLHIGIPILRNENKKFRELYDGVLKSKSYEQKIAAMTVFDLPVTRLMTTHQLHTYLDKVHLKFTEMGIQLTDPDERLYKAMIATRKKEAA